MPRSRHLVAVACAVALVALVPPPAEAGLSDDTPVPTRARVDGFAQSLGFEIGTVAIAAIGLEAVVREGVAQAVIDAGVAHWAGTAMPGGVGNVVLAGHRTVGPAPFRDLDRLRPGDEIVLRTLDGRSVTYRVTETFIVTPEDVWIVDQATVPMLTLFACHPKGSARQRIVVRAELVGAPLVRFP